jgi:hypothetical protein
VDSNCSDDSTKELTRLKQKWSVYSHGDLKQRVREIGSDKYLVEGLLPDRSLGLLVGDSGLGKSPLVYQMAVCIAAGIPFLDRAVKQSNVLCMDFENGLGQVAEMLDSICQHLGLSGAPNNLVLWNINDAETKYGQPGHTALDVIRQVRPDLVIIDSLTGMFSDIEERNSYAIKYLQQLRELIRECGTSSFSLHHIKKPSDDPRYAPPSLETCSNVRQWFLQARGARALINGTDIRLGVDTPEIGNVLIAKEKNKEEIALVMGGFGRVRGEIPLTYLSRYSDESGEPLGYGVVSGVSLLFDKEREEALAKLPEKFRFKDAKQALGKADQATQDFLNKCIGLRLVHKISKKEGYEKLIVAE